MTRRPVGDFAGPHRFTGASCTREGEAPHAARQTRSAPRANTLGMIRFPAMTELPTTFGKYYLTEKLATGGMAEIYLAKLIGPGGFEKQLVIKQIHPRLSGQR